MNRSEIDVQLVSIDGREWVHFISSFVIKKCFVKQVFALKSILSSAAAKKEPLIASYYARVKCTTLRSWMPTHARMPFVFRPVHVNNFNTLKETAVEHWSNFRMTRLGPLLVLRRSQGEAGRQKQHGNHFNNWTLDLVVVVTSCHAVF